MATRIKEEREKQKISPRSLASSVNVSPSAVSMWENGTTKNIRPDNLLAIADALGVTVRWLVTGRGQKNIERSLHAADDQGTYNRSTLSADGVEVCQQWEKLPRDSREQARQFIYLLTLLTASEHSITPKNLPKKYSDFEKLISRTLLHKKPQKAA